MFSNHFEELLMKRKEERFCRKFHYRGNWQKLVGFNPSLRCFLDLTWRRSLFILPYMTVAKSGIKHIKNDVERCLSLVRCHCFFVNC